MVNQKHRRHHHCSKHKHKYVSLLHVIKRNKALSATLKCSSLTNLELLFALEEICARFNSVAIEETPKATKPNDFNVFDTFSKCWVILNRIPESRITFLSEGRNEDIVLPNDKPSMISELGENDTLERTVLRAPRLINLQLGHKNAIEVLRKNVTGSLIVDGKPNSDSNVFPVINASIIDETLPNVNKSLDVTIPLSKETTKIPKYSTNRGNVKVKFKAKPQIKIPRFTLNHASNVKVPEEIIKGNVTLKECSVIVNRLSDIQINLFKNKLGVESLKDSKPKEIRECCVILRRVSITKLNNNEALTQIDDSLMHSTKHKENVEHNIKNVDHKTVNFQQEFCKTEQNSFCCSFCEYKTFFKTYYESHLFNHMEEKDFSCVLEAVQKLPLKNNLLNCTKRRYTHLCSYKQ